MGRLFAAEWRYFVAGRIALRITPLLRGGIVGMVLRAAG
jgi:hypothetical protein